MKVVAGITIVLAAVVSLALFGAMLTQADDSPVQDAPGVVVFEDGSGRLSGTATLSDGQEIVVDGATFCVPGGLCND